MAEKNHKCSCGKSKKPKHQLCICPPATEPKEPQECEQERADFVAGNPYLRFDLALQYYFFNRQEDFVSSTQNCAELGSGFRPITVQELNDIRAELTAAGLCPMLVWTTNDRIPTLAYFIPGQPVTIVPTPTIFCPAYFFCVANLE